MHLRDTSTAVGLARCIYPVETTSSRSRHSTTTPNFEMAESDAPMLAIESGAPPPEMPAAGGAAMGGQPPQGQGEEGHKEELARDDTNGIVVFGQFVAGSLVGIIIAAPAFVVLFFGASGSLVTKAGSKVMRRGLFNTRF